MLSTISENPNTQITRKHDFLELKEYSLLWQNWQPSLNGGLTQTIRGWAPARLPLVVVHFFIGVHQNYAQSYFIRVTLLLAAYTKFTHWTIFIHFTLASHSSSNLALHTSYYGHPMHDCYLLFILAQWVYARLISERPQMQVQSLPKTLLRSLKQSPIDGNCLRWSSA